ncbi:MAG: cation:proton antiporter [Deltaproteobacteria bacterium]|nr:cation:proton antiporter [Deltaproteobacteria bacterium]MBW1820072.1 cation:proton antiporter [Deltaproteobacteria bacterium]
MYENLAILGTFVFLYSITSGGLEKTPINGALVFTAFGLAVGPLGLDLLTGEVDSEGLRTLAELTLALLLFADAANANLDELKQFSRIPLRLLLIGLPLTILLGFGTGVILFSGLTLLEIAVLATILSPTDAALGKAVVTNKTVPSNIRESLNVESGLNDGICVPILFLFLALVTKTGVEEGTSILAIKLLAEEIGIGGGVGVGLTLLGWLLLKRFGDRGWVTETWLQLPVPALSVACFAVAQWIGGSGFIACFVGGLLFGRIVSNQHKHKLLLSAEGTADTLALITWVAFGAAVVGRSIGALSWQVLLYAVLSLTLIRMVPVFLALSGLKMRTDEKLFIGWFGPRGLASIVFAVIVLNAYLPGGDIISMTATCTIILSVVAHGISATPLVASLGARLQRAAGEKEAGGLRLEE